MEPGITNETTKWKWDWDLGKKITGKGHLAIQHHSFFLIGKQCCLEFYNDKSYMHLELLAARSNSIF